MSNVQEACKDFIKVSNEMLQTFKIDKTSKEFEDDKMVISFETSKGSINKIYLNKTDNVIDLDKKEMILLRDLFDITLRENESEDIEELLIPYSDI